MSDITNRTWTRGQSGRSLFGGLRARFGSLMESLVAASARQSPASWSEFYRFPPF